MNHALAILDLLLGLAKRIGAAIADGKPERVDQILPEQLRTSLERMLAEERARAKFDGPSPIPSPLPATEVES